MLEVCQTGFPIETLARALGPKANRPANVASFSEIRIEDGTIEVNDAARGIKETLSNVDLALAWPSISKSFAATGHFVWHSEPVDTTIALTHIIFEGLLDRFPGTRIVAAHGGGFLASYIGRFDNCNALQAPCQRMMKKPSEYLRGPQLSFDSLVYSPQNVRHLVTTVGASQVVIGTDFGFPIADGKPVDTILQTPGLTPDEQIAILGGNAARLLKLPTG